MQIVFGLLFLLFFSACCLCVAACTRFDAALLPLPALCGSAVVLYLLSLLGLLQFGHFIIMAVWLAGGVYFGVRAGWRAIRRALFSPGFLLFVGGSCFLWVLFALQQPMFTQWDEFTAWGLAPKMVAERAALYVADPINLTASFTYPATSLVSYLFQRVPGQFYEWQCLAGLDILFLACIAPAAAMPRKNWAGAVLVFAAGFLLPFFSAWFRRAPHPPFTPTPWRIPPWRCCLAEPCACMPRRAGAKPAFLPVPCHLPC